MNAYSVEYRNGKPAILSATPKYLIVNAASANAAQLGAQQMLDSEGVCVTVTDCQMISNRLDTRAPIIGYLLAS